MKRVESACLQQTLIFVLDPNFPENEAREKVEKEVRSYKEGLSPDKGKIVNEVHNQDGTVTIKVKKAVSGYEVGSYFD